LDGRPRFDGVVDVSACPVVVDSSAFVTKERSCSCVAMGAGYRTDGVFEIGVEVENMRPTL